MTSYYLYCILVISMRTKNSLTPKEKKESMGVTLGRLKTAIEYNHSKKRQLYLVKKLYKDYDKIFIIIMGKELYEQTREV